MTVPTASRLQRYLMVVVRWLLIAFVVFVLTILSGVYITDHWFPKVYISSAQIQIRPKDAAISGSAINHQGWDAPLQTATFQPELEIMESPDVLLPVISDLNLDKTWAARFSKSKEDRLTSSEALAHMRKILKLDYMRGTNIISITASSDVPKEAADIADAVAKQYETLRNTEEAARNNRGTDTLRSQIAEQQKVVEDKKAALEKLREDLSKPSSTISIPSAEEKQNETELNARKKDLLTAKEDYDARQVLLKNVINLPDDQFIATLNGLGRDIKITSDPAHPPNKDQVAGLRRAMQIDTDMAKSRVELLQEEVDVLTAKMAPDSQPIRDAQRQLEQGQSLLDALNVRLKQDIADEQLQQSPVRIVALAEIPKVPAKPNRILCLVVTVLAAGFLGVASSSFVEIMFLVSRASKRPGN